MKKIVFITNAVIQWIHSIYLVLQILVISGLASLTYPTSMQDINMFLYLLIGSLVLYSINLVFYFICKRKGIEIKFLKYNISNAILLFISFISLFI
ncbi:MAG: hypothetical protein II984_02530 [Clostridia bacterium]|nr:hypothetical protein [Clostridia bacterium]